MMTKPPKTGFCWNCGRICKELFCNDKCKQKYELRQSRQVKQGKKAGYGITGSTH